PRVRPAPDRVVHGLRDAAWRHVPRHAHREQSGAHEAEPAGRQGRGRGRHGRCPARGDERGHRRAGVGRRAPARHAGDARARVAGDPGREGAVKNEEQKERNVTLDDKSLDLLFLKARTQNGWLPTPVTDDQLRRIYDIMRMGPTSANSCPARILFVRTPEAKARLLPALSPGNVDKTKQAPVTAIVGYDTRFYEWMPKKLFTHRPDMAENYAKNPALAEI